MPYREIVFEKNQLVHITSRAVEGIKIFSQTDDCFRFVFQLYAANVGRPAPGLWRRDIDKAVHLLLQGESPSSRFVIKEHQPFVLILDFALVLNHYHLYLLSNIEDSVPLFMQKLNLGFSRYFNFKHKRRGTLFGGPYKSILTKTQFQSDAVSRYVSIINPLDIYQPGWREEGLKDWEKALEFLKNYKFSSFPDKIGKRNAKILAPKEIRERYSFKIDPESNEQYLNFVKDFLRERSFVSPYPFFLE